jgi:RNA polymerase sigma-70 factor (ECF subfamily)
MAEEEGIIGTYLSLRRNLARSVMGIVPPKDVEDIVQETYVRACQIERKGVIKAPRSYLYRVARNLALDYVKCADNSLTDNVASMDDGQEERALLSAEMLADEVYEQASTNEEFALFCDAVRQLPIQCRRVFVLRKVYGYSQNEIAQEMNVTASTVEKHIAKGMKRCLFYMQQTDSNKSDSFLNNKKSAQKQDGWKKLSQLRSGDYD